MSNDSLFMGNEEETAYQYGNNIDFLKRNNAELKWVKEQTREFALFCSPKQNQATAKPAFRFERAYTKQKRKSRSDEPAKQEVFVSEKGTKEKTIWYLSRFAGNNTGVLL